MDSPDIMVSSPFESNHIISHHDSDRRSPETLTSCYEHTDKGKLASSTSCQVPVIIINGSGYMNSMTNQASEQESSIDPMLSVPCNSETKQTRFYIPESNPSHLLSEMNGDIKPSETITNHISTPTPIITGQKCYDSPSCRRKRLSLRKLNSMDNSKVTRTDKRRLISSRSSSVEQYSPPRDVRGASERNMSLPEDLDEIGTFNKLEKKEIDENGLDGRDSVMLSLTEEEARETFERRPTEFRLKDQLFSFFQASDNKLAMKLFGSRNALLKEKNRQKSQNEWIIHPCSNFRLYWDLLMLVFLVTNLVVLPVSIAFFYKDSGIHWIVFNITCDTMFIFDIIVNFRTGLIDDQSQGHIILDSKVIAKRYLKSWFIVDFISSFPLDYVFLGLEEQPYSAGRALKILRLAKLLQLLRLLRISRLVRYVKLWQEYFSIASIVMKLFNLICVMVLMGHWSGCIQFFVPIMQGLPADCWIVEDGIQNLHWFDQYTRALFKALSHMLCIGYGQYPPRNTTDTWLTIASMLAGATCYALFIGHATTLIQSFDTSSRQFRDHLQQVNEYMIYRKLPTDLRRRITDYYDHRFGGKRFDERAILTEISDSLRNDVIHHNCKELLKTVPFFINAESGFVADVITRLLFEMFQPGDVIIKSGTKGDRMFFIQEGMVEIVREEDSKIITRLTGGSYFGEIALLSKGERCATVIAGTYCNLFSLSKDNFDRILECYPVMKRTLETIAAQRLTALGYDPKLVASRESLKDDIDGIKHVFQSHVTDDDSDEEYCNSPCHTHETKKDNSQFLTAVKGFFTKDSEVFSVHRSHSSINRHSFANSPNDTPLKTCKSTLQHLIVVPGINEQTNPALKRRCKSSVEMPVNLPPLQPQKTSHVDSVSIETKKLLSPTTPTIPEFKKKRRSGAELVELRCPLIRSQSDGEAPAAVESPQGGRKSPTVLWF